MGITQSITINGLTPGQIAILQDFIDQVIIRGHTWVLTSGPAGIPTTNELAQAPLPPVAPVAAPSPAPTAASAPVAPDGHAAAPGAGDAPRDSRGVPHHPAFHAALTSTSGGLKGDGTWKRKRNHDEAAADAYEAQYLQPQSQAAAAARELLDAFPVPPLVAAPPPLASPTQQQLETLWTELALANKVGPDHSNYLGGWLGWPIVANDAYRNDPERRRVAYEWLGQYR